MVTSPVALAVAVSLSTRRKLLSLMSRLLAPPRARLTWPDPVIEPFWLSAAANLSTAMVLVLSDTPTVASCSFKPVG